MLRWFITSVCCFLVLNAFPFTPVSDPGTRGVDWDSVKTKIQNHSWAQEILDSMKEDVRTTMERYDHPPLGKTGWLHEYYCDEDATRLRFDPDKPNEHVCPTCERVYSGSPYDDCWRSLVHSQMSTAAAQSAMIYRITGESNFLEYPKNILLWYAEHFDEFEPHGEHAGKGIIREQSLDEATQLVRLAQAYWDIAPFLSENERNKIVNEFMLPDAKFIHQQTGTIHNIHSWHNAAVGLVGFAIGDEKLVEQTIDGNYGLKKQIQEGVKEDGFWYEGSISYHYYTIRSLQPLYLAAKAQDYPLQETEKFEKMYTAPIRFTFPDGQFPSNNDGWPGLNIRNMASYYETASSLFDSPEITETLAAIYEEKSRTAPEALIYGSTEIPEKGTYYRESAHFEDSGIAILRNDNLNAYLKYGPYGGGHDHHDRLNMIFFARNHVVIPDLGTSGYGIPLNQWYRSSAAHNLLIVDGKRQARCGGYLLSYDPEHIHAGVDEAYSGVDIQRKINLKSHGIVDRLNVTSEEQHQYDLIYHVRGTLQSHNLELKEAENFDLRNGYDYLQNLQHGVLPPDHEPLVFTWKLREDEGEMRLQCPSQESMEIYIGTCPDNPANKTMAFVMFRKTTQEWELECNLSLKP